jgi:hypothetical protein
MGPKKINNNNPAARNGGNNKKNNGYGGGGRGGPAAPAPAASSSNTSGGGAPVVIPPMLIHVTTGSNNLQPFTKILITWAESKYGYCGTLVRTKRHYVPPIIPPPTAEELSPENDPFGFVKDAYRDAVKERNKQVAEIHSKWINFSADLELSV